MAEGRKILAFQKIVIIEDKTMMVVMILYEYIRSAQNCDINFIPASSFKGTFLIN
jgi:hypothetical protein